PALARLFESHGDGALRRVRVVVDAAVVLVHGLDGAHHGATPGGRTGWIHRGGHVLIGARLGPPRDGGRPRLVWAQPVRAAPPALRRLDRGREEIVRVDGDGVPVGRQ